MLGYTQIRPCFQSHHLRWTDAFFQGALDYAGIQGFAPVGTKALNLVAGTHLLKVGSSLGWGQGFLFYSSPKKQSIFRQRTAPLCDGGNRASFCQIPAYRTKSVSGPIIHSFRNGYLVLWWSSSHTRPSSHFSGREASSALMPYRSLSRSTSASVGISRSVSAIVFGHSTCR